MSLWKRILDTLIDPNIIVLLLSLGALGITVELFNPGLIFPGTFGAISLIVAFFGLQVLPVSAAGILLILLAAAFFAAEPFVMSHGALALAGAACFVIGSLMLFDPAGPGYQVSIWVALAIAGTFTLLMVFALTKIVQARRRRPVTGQEELVGQVGVVRKTLDPAGLVFIHGELWQARSDDEPIGIGEDGRGRRASTRGSSSRCGERKPPCPSRHRIGPPRKRSPMLAALIAIAAVVVIILFLLSAAIRITREYERGVIFRLGRLHSPPKGPGLFLLIPVVDKMVRVDLRTVTLNIPPQEVITKDNVPVRVNAVAYFRIIDPEKAIVQVENFMVATSQISQTTLRSVLGQHVLDELLSERDKINAILQEIIDEATSPWGIKVSIVEVKDVEIPTGMQRAMARQAEAERERRAKVIAAEGEFQASERLKDAANVMSENPITLQLRFLQTMLEISSERSSTTDPSPAARALQAVHERIQRT